jgi:hypothetical protein
LTTTGEANEENKEPPSFVIRSQVLETTETPTEVCSKAKAVSGPDAAASLVDRAGFQAKQAGRVTETAPSKEARSEGLVGDVLERDVLERGTRSQYRASP